MALALDPAVGSTVIDANVTLHSTGQTVAVSATAATVGCKTDTPPQCVPAAGASAWTATRRMLVLEDIHYPTFIELFLAALAP